MSEEEVEEVRPGGPKKGSIYAESFTDKITRHNDQAAERGQAPNGGRRHTDESRALANVLKNRRQYGGWDALTEKTRIRYNQLGFTQEMYERGDKVPPTETKEAARSRSARKRREQRLAEERGTEGKVGRKKLVKMPGENGEKGFRV